jgi:hypothetical protein
VLVFCDLVILNLMDGLFPAGMTICACGGR